MAAISVQGVSKKFRLFDSSRDRFLEALHPFKKKYHRDFWALKDITFEVEKGATAGIVGRNGSGKTTLLEIISSVLRPTTGTVRVDGRVFPLLELGAGFNPELTGRENVFLKGTLMGLTRTEMERRLPLIEAFAEIGDFIKQPVRVYSSGMFVRLAFATAINVDPDILIVDEALSVGDARFQHKCFNKFLDFQDSGKTILFVSHSTEAVVRHCDTAILLEGGRIVERGEPKKVVNRYIDLLFSNSSPEHAPEPRLLEEGYGGFNIVHFGQKFYAIAQELGSIDIGAADNESMDRLMAGGGCVAAASEEGLKTIIDGLNPGRGEIKRDGVDAFFREAPVSDNCPKKKSYNKNEYRHGDRRAGIVDYLIASNSAVDPVSVRSGDIIDIYMKVRFYERVDLPMFGFSVNSTDGVMVYGTNTRMEKIAVSPALPGRVSIVKWTVRLCPNSGDYFINLGVAEKRPGMDLLIDNRKDLIHIKVLSEADFDGLARFETSFEEFPEGPAKPV